MKSQALQAILLSLSICSVYASLSYSIPDLGYDRFWRRNNRVVTSATQLLPSISPLLLLSAGTTPRQLPHLNSSNSVFSATNHQTEPVRPSDQQTPTLSAPFPTISNTTNISRTGGLHSSAHVTSSPAKPGSTKVLNNSTTFIPPLSSTQTLSSFRPESPINNTGVSTSSSHLVANNTVILVTVTPSGASPVIITRTVTPSNSLSSLIPSAGQTATTKRPTLQFTSSRKSLSPTSLSSALQPPSDGSVFGTMMSNLPSPSQAPGGGEEPRVQFPPPFVIDTVIDGLVYQLPYPNEPAIEIMLFDGSKAQLLAGKVVMRGQTLTIPTDLSSAQLIVVGGQSITAQPGESKKPDSNDHEGGRGGGGGGPFALLGKLVGAAGSAAKTITTVATDAVGFGSGATGTGGTAAGALAGTFLTAINGVNGVVSSLNGIQKAFPLDSLTKAGMNTFLGAQNLGRNSLDCMRSTGKLLEKFDTLEPEVQQQVRDSIRDYFKPDGPLQQAAAAMKGLSDFPWEAEAPTTKLPSPTAASQPTESAQATKAISAQSSRMISSTSVKTTSKSTNSSSTTPTPTKELTPYYFATKSGTSSDTFKNFTEALDGGIGKAEETTIRQIYRTHLNSSQAAELYTRFPFLLVAYADTHNPEEAESSEEIFHVIPTIRSKLPVPIDLDVSEDQSVTSWPSLLSRAPLPGGDNAPYWKKMVSSPFRQHPRPSADDPPYAADDSGGSGTTIYVIDDGFDITQPDLTATGRTVDIFFVSNEDAFPDGFLEREQKLANRRNAFLETARLGGGSGHGTRMATIAAGKTHGIAPNANLYLMKMKGEWNKGTLPTTRNEGYATQPKALLSVLDEIQIHVQNRINADNNAKSVINMSWGLNPTSELERILRGFLEWSERLKITIVAAAGNSPERRLHQTVPQMFGTLENRMITVGGVEKDGTLYQETTTAKPGEPGSISVYAPTRDIAVPSPGNAPHTGTSQAAAIVSGLVAYLYAAPGVGSILHPDIPSPAENMKQFIVAHAWTRVPRSQLGTLESLDVVYNLAYGDTAHPQDPCAIQFRKRDDSLVSACSHTATVSLPLASSQPTSSINTPSSPTPPVTPSSDKCRIFVNEYDHVDSNNHGKEIWNVNIYPDTGVKLRDSTQLCITGADAEERSGVDVKCEPIGEAFHLQRDKDELLRFIWGTQTWTANDARCKVVRNWYEFDAKQADKRKRETECVFECKIDWSKPPTMVVTR